MKSFITNNYNYILISALFSWIFAQIFKFIIHFIIKKEINFKRLIGSGGMPSSHSAFVSSATIAAYRQLGVSTPEFAIIFIIAVIVMYDAMGVRRAAGEQAKTINKINKILYDNNEISKNDLMTEYNSKELEEYLGHTPFQVLGGALLGILVALVVPMN